MDRSDSEFPVPASVAGYSKQGQSFQESHGNMSPTKKGTFALICLDCFFTTSRKSSWVKLEPVRSRVFSATTSVEKVHIPRELTSFLLRTVTGKKTLIRPP